MELFCSCMGTYYNSRFDVIRLDGYHPGAIKFVALGGRKCTLCFYHKRDKKEFENKVIEGVSIIKIVDNSLTDELGVNLLLVKKIIPSSSKRELVLKYNELVEVEK